MKSGTRSASGSSSQKLSARNARNSAIAISPMRLGRSDCRAERVEDLLFALLPTCDEAIASKATADRPAWHRRRSGQRRERSCREAAGHNRATGHGASHARRPAAAPLSSAKTRIRAATSAAFARRRGFARGLPPRTQKGSPRRTSPAREMRPCRRVRRSAPGILRDRPSPRARNLPGDTCRPVPRPPT